MADNTCKVCGEQYPAYLKKCPRCGTARNSKVPAWLCCSRCGAFMSSRRRTCPDCGQVISPRTATVAFLPKRKPGQRWRTAAIWGGAVVVAAGLLAVEGFLVEKAYAHDAYQRAMELWDCGGSIEANRREPDPIYEQEVEEPRVAQTTDSLFDSLVREAHIADSLAAAAPSDGEVPEAEVYDVP